MTNTSIVILDVRLWQKPTTRLVIHSVAGIDCDFNRSTQHFVGKPLSRKNTFESGEYLKFQWDTERLSIEMLNALPD